MLFIRGAVNGVDGTVNEIQNWSARKNVGCQGIPLQSQY